MHMYIDTHKAPQTSSCCMSSTPFESHSFAVHVKNICRHAYQENGWTVSPDRHCARCFWQNLDKLQVVLDMLTFLDLKPCKRGVKLFMSMRKWINHFTSFKDGWAIISMEYHRGYLGVHSSSKVKDNQLNSPVTVVCGLKPVKCFSWCLLNIYFWDTACIWLIHPPTQTTQTASWDLVIILSSSCHSWWPLADHSLRHQHLLRHEAQQGLASSAGL